MEPTQTRNLAEVLDIAADQFGDRVAWGPADSGTTYAELRRLAWAVADRLTATGADRVALTGGNDLLVPAVIFGAAYAGRTYVPINGRLPSTTITRLLERLEPVATADATWLDDVARATPRPPADSAAPAVLVFTSGTTADPKAVVLHHHQLLGSSFRQPPGSADEKEVVLLTAPPFHVPNLALVLGSVLAGRRLLPLPGERFSPETWLDVVEAERVTHVMVVPTMLHRIVEAQEAAPRDVSSLERLTYGSARMPPSVLERALRVFPSVGFLNGYGMTETSGVVTVLTPDDHRDASTSDDPRVRSRLGSVGRPLPGVEVRVVTDGDEAAEPFEEGEIRIRGPQVSEGYLEGASKLDEEGWLRSGDRGWIDDGGYLFCVGRGDDTIIRGGENIAAAEVEDVLMRHPAIGEAAVVGVPDEEWGEQIIAMVTVRAGHPLDVESVQGWVREHLGSLKTPASITAVPELPQTATGKVLRRAVRSQLLGSA